MKPRIFISSTFYDLKYIREDLANFVRSYGYEPILFEDGDIGYTPGKTLDSSCYNSMRNLGNKYYGKRWVFLSISYVIIKTRPIIEIILIGLLFVGR